LRSSLLLQLANADQHPGKLLHYLPDRPSRDPIAGEACVEVPTELARTTRHFKLNSARQIRSFENKSLNASTVQTADYPRELMLEITTRRSTFPAFGPAKHFPIARPDLTLELAQKIFHEFGSIDDLRLTLGGVGDPLCHPNFFEIVESARAAGIAAIHVETDLYELDTAQVAGLVEAGIDIISVNIPALTTGTYQKLMGINGYETVIQNIKQLVLRRQGLARGTPIVVPTFVKCRENFAEMEPWYDQWLKALGTAVINGPTIFDDASPSISDMTPSKRKPCARLNHRMTILSDGQIVSCDNDVFARQVLGQIKTETALKIWNGPASQLRADHALGQWQKHSLCASCKEWYRP
jgi:radical SAM protein with 4Fe4S-binding SPASM domain